MGCKVSVLEGYRRILKERKWKGKRVSEFNLSKNIVREREDDDDEVIHACKTLLLLSLSRVKAFPLLLSLLLLNFSLSLSLSCLRSLGDVMYLLCLFMIYAKLKQINLVLRMENATSSNTTFIFKIL